LVKTYPLDALSAAQPIAPTARLAVLRLLMTAKPINVGDCRNIHVHPSR